MLRTWKDPWTVKPNLTYVGGEVILWPIVFIGPRIGLLRAINTSERQALVGDLRFRHWSLAL